MIAGVVVGVYLFVLALIIAAIPVVKLIGWWMDGGADGGLVAVAIFLYVAMLAGVITAPTGFGVFLLLLIVASAIAMPLLGQASDAVQLKQINDSQYRSYAEALERNPMDPVARVAIAEALYKRGETDQAIEQMEWVLQQFPKLAITKKGKLDFWIRERERQRGERPEIVICHKCHAENIGGVENCSSCGAFFGTKKAVREQVRREGGPVRILRVWIVTASASIVAVFVLTLLPIEFAAPVILAIVIVAAWLFLRWVGGDMGVMEQT